MAEMTEELKRRILAESPAERQERLARAAADPNRPLYHYLPPPSWMNDPNGPIHWKGVYHMFFQWNRDLPWWGNIQWGHASSEDLVHWTTLPLAIEPTPGGPDAGGCFSGSMVDHDGVPTMVYTGVSPEVQCLATGDDGLIRWTKHPANPVIAAPPDGVTVTGFRDPCPWREGDTWYVLIGSGFKDVGGTSLLYRSNDLVRWEYLHPFYEPDAARPMHECPDFFPLGDKHALLTSWTGMHVEVGTYADLRFTPESHTRLDWGNYYAAKSLADANGRRIVWGWVTEGRSVEEQIRAGWSGVLSLPRVLTLGEDGGLRQAFAPELASLRDRGWGFSNLRVPSDGVKTLDRVAGDGVEIQATFSANRATRFGLRVQDDLEIAYDREKGEIVGAPLTLGDGESLTLHIYVDRSVTEFIAGGRVAKTLRCYRNGFDGLRLSLFSEGGETVAESLTVWRLRSI
jgi:beta-fructofuranosidase